MIPYPWQDIQYYEIDELIGAFNLDWHLEFCKCGNLMDSICNTKYNVLLEYAIAKSMNL